MQLKEFLKELGKTPRQWSVSDDALLRMTDNGCRLCPLEAVARAHNVSSSLDYDYYFFGLGKQLDLPPRLVSRILTAADNAGYPATRKALLKACGL